VNSERPHPNEQGGQDRCSSILRAQSGLTLFWTRTVLAGTFAAVSDRRCQKPLSVDWSSVASRLKATARQALAGRANPILALLIGASALFLFSEAAAHIVGGPSVVDLSAVFAASTLSSIVGFAFFGNLRGAGVSFDQHAGTCRSDYDRVQHSDPDAERRNPAQFDRLAPPRAFPARRNLGTAARRLHADSPVFRALLEMHGCFLIVYGLYMLFRRAPSAIRDSRPGDYAARFLGGVTGGFAGFPGAFVTNLVRAKGVG